ncbi:PEPxxWA-CTERM sorting domain-containing protein [Sphingomonas endophytica]|nr:PEPxxWA-CTERM sorting domain-containing protein [Sphingomonas endophytica]
MLTMRAFGAAAALSTAAIATPATATDFDFVFSGNSGVAGSSGAMDFAATSSGQRVDVRASAWSMKYSMSAGGYVISAANIGNYADGLGVTAPSENGGSGTHTIDNAGTNKYDFLLLQFSAPVKLTQIVTTAFRITTDLTSYYNSGDSDATVGYGTTTNAWNNTLNYDGKNWSVLSSALTRIAVYDSASGGTVSGGAASNMWMVSAMLNNPDGRIDSFKLGGLSATTVGGAVPEPATWLTMILGFGVVGAALRRRRGGRTIAAA